MNRSNECSMFIVHINECDEVSKKNKKQILLKILDMDESVATVVNLETV